MIAVAVDNVISTSTDDVCRTSHNSRLIAFRSSRTTAFIERWSTGICGLLVVIGGWITLALWHACTIVTFELQPSVKIMFNVFRFQPRRNNTSIEFNWATITLAIVLYFPCIHDYNIFKTIVTQNTVPKLRRKHWCCAGTVGRKTQMLSQDCLLLRTTYRQPHTQHGHSISYNSTVIPWVHVFPLQEAPLTSIRSRFLVLLSLFHTRGRPIIVFLSNSVPFTTV